MSALQNLAHFLARVFLGALFLYDGYLVLRTPSGAASLISRLDIKALPPNTLAIVLGALMVIGGLLLVLGLWTRFAALGFAAFCVATAIFFHYRPGETSEMIQMGKDLGLAGGYLLLAMAGPGPWSIEARRGGM